MARSASFMHRQLPHHRRGLSHVHNHGYRSNSYNTYWILDRPSKPTKENLKQQLDYARCYAKSNLRHGELAELVRTKVYGQLGYSKLQNVELQKFVDARGLTVAEGSTKKGLVKALVDADQNRQFTRLFDLPSELREMICTVYLTEFVRENGLLDPSQPPLARTCRQLRHDVLPQFFKLAKFEIEFSLGVDAKWPATSIAPGPSQMTNASAAFLSRIPRKYMKNLRTLQVRSRDNHWNTRDPARLPPHHINHCTEIKIDPSGRLREHLESYSKKGSANQRNATRVEWTRLKAEFEMAAEGWYEEAMAEEQRRGHD